MVDYSKWKNIEISDDEDDTHPNIDTPSLFRWRHQARLDRMAELDRERDELEKRQKSHQARLIVLQDRIQNEHENDTELESLLEQLQLEGKQLEQEVEEFTKKEKNQPWNVDTISKTGFAKTMINKETPILPEEPENPSEEERNAKIAKFVEANEQSCKEYGMLRNYNDSICFLRDHQDLVCNQTTHYLAVWAINLELEKKHELMSRVAHQCVCMQYILELGKQLKMDPRACVASFFTKIQCCVPEYRDQFISEVNGLKERIQKRAADRIRETLFEIEAKEREARLGPGGLDPVEVFEELPVEMKKCFESRDMELLQNTIASMSVDNARYFMQRCIGAGLWIPNKPATAAGNTNNNSNDGDNSINSNSNNTNNKSTPKAGQGAEF